MNSSQNPIIERSYTACSYSISNQVEDSEAKEYHGASFTLNDKYIIYRKGKETPNKMGLFVTFWKRNEKGITVPYSENDPLDFYIITAVKEDQVGQFIIPKATLVSKGILSTAGKDGKRGFRVYPPWAHPKSRLAQRTQDWQLKNFVAFKKADSAQKLNALLSK